MAADSVKLSEDAEMEECNDGKIVTMMDVLQEQQEFEDDANAVLGGSDDKNCTYNKGYMKRQALYSCLTCCPEAKTDRNKRAGVCLACSLNCHENHELVELYTKRNFRCDCGNPKFPQPCQFTPNKMDLNYDNKYNQNFSGIYCTCLRPYPDPEATEEEEMIQCIICEDWLHTKHLEATIPDNENYAEMICKECMEEYDFLHDYSDLIVNVEDKEVIVTDPDLEVTPIIKTKSIEEEKEKLTNGNADTKSKDDAEPDSITEENKKDSDVDMNEAKPEEEKESITADDTAKDTSSTDDKANESTSNDDAAKPDQNVESKPEMEGEISTSAKETAESTESKEEKAAEPSEGSKDESETPTDKPDETDTAAPVPDKNDEKSEAKTDIQEEAKVQDNTKNGETPEKPETKRKLSTDEANAGTSPKKQKLDPCTRPKGVKRVYKGSTFWPANLRQTLCTCGECISMYKDLGILYLTDPEDTVTAYEALGKEYSDGGSSSQYEKGMQALSSLDRVQQINALTEYNNMRDKLLDFLKSFKDKKEIVKEEDIKAFFAGMKPKREPDGVYFCR